MKLTRREFLVSSGAATVVPLLPRGALAAAESENARLARLARDGLRTRLGVVDPAHAARLEHELGVIVRLDVALPFLVAADVVRHAHRRGIALGPGRGAVPGSLVCWALGVTDVDPIRYRLLFERFVNARRSNPSPMICMDVCIRRRDELIRALLDEAPPGRFALARAPSNRARTFLCEAASAQPDLSDVVYEAISRTTAGRVEDALAQDAGLAALAREAPLAEIVADARRIEARLGPLDDRWTGCALLFGRQPVPSERSAGGWSIAPMDADEAERRGWFCLRLARSATTTVLGAAGPTPAEPDARACEHLTGAWGEAMPGEECWLAEVGRAVRPASLEHAAAALALSRPGPIEGGMLAAYAARRHGRRRADIPHPALQPILAPTYGLPIYQEQVMQLAEAVAGFDLEEADLLRRAFGKKKPDDMERWRRRFLRGAAGRGFDAATADRVLNMMETYTGYAFNRSHAIALARAATAVAHFQAHDPAGFARAAATVV